MPEEKQAPGFFDKLAAVIVDKRKIVLCIYVIALALSFVTSGWVSVCNDLTAYLPEETETRKGLTVMENELVTYGTARVMVSQVTYDIADRLADEISDIDGVNMVTFDDTTDHFKGTDALIDVTFAGDEDADISKQAMNDIKDLLSPYDTYISSSVGYSLADTLNEEMGVILILAGVIIVAVLLLTSRSYAEVPVLILTFAAAALLNKGTNFIFGEISFVSDSVTVVLQLALAIDYAIILLHRFTEERETKSERDACVAALAASIPAISASSLTTISGLAAMMFMQFRIGFDMGIILIKAICFSMLAVFTLMPALLMMFSSAMERTRHRSFIPQIDAFGRLVVKLRYVGAPLFAVCIVAAAIISQNCPYVYGYSLITTPKQNESQIAEDRVDAAFGTQNVMALLVPKGDYDREAALLTDLEACDEVDYAMGLANIEAIDGYMLTSKLTPRQFAEMTDMDYELICGLYAAYAANDEDYAKIVGGIDSYAVPLMDMFSFVYDQVEAGAVSLDDDMRDDLDDLHEQLDIAKAQMIGENYDRMVVALALPEEGDETFAFLDTIHEIAEKYYDADNIYLVGDSTSDSDLASTFVQDNILISVLSIVFVVLVLLFTFQSVGLPILLILIIQGSIWLNFAFPAITDTHIFFMSYLIITAIQMGANIDYAIVISTRYDEMKALYEPKEAIVHALSLAFPTIITSGGILVSAAFLISRISTEPSIVGIGQCLCRGTIISIFLVMCILPEILLLGDTIVEKTRFAVKLPAKPKAETSGMVYINGHVRGQINGYVEGNVRAIVRGDTDLKITNGTVDRKEGDEP